MENGYVGPGCRKWYGPWIWKMVWALNMENGMGPEYGKWYGPWIWKMVWALDMENGMENGPWILCAILGLGHRMLYVILGPWILYSLPLHCTPAFPGWHQ
jgi:hypothetical protein